jgi:internalin A
VSTTTGSIDAAELRKASRTGVLDLSGRGLTQLPIEVFELPKLRKLGFDDNRLSILPPKIASLSGLEELWLRRNRLRGLPTEVSELACLRVLLLDGNPLRAFPSVILQLTNLRELWLNSVKLTSLTGEISRLSNLETLELSHNQLGSLPPETGQLRQLSNLMLDNNKLTSLPPEIGLLTRMKTLYLSFNQLTNLPPEIANLRDLKDLMLAGNRLTDFPPSIGDLTWLERLNLSGNRLANVPPEIGRLTLLSSLDLQNNQIATLPSAIGRLTKLYSLDLRNNHLTTLPSQLAVPLAGGAKLSLAGNPLQDPLPEIIGRGSDALATYLKSVKKGRPQYEAKVLLVGEGNVGKSSLVAALHDEPFVRDRPTTHGIEITPLTLRHPKLDQDIIVRTWDFGGQEVYRVTHQFFFGRRAVYLLVWNAREGQEQNEVEDWLRRIYLRVGVDARVLVVATHCDERHPELDYAGLKRIFPEILVGQCEIDSLTGTGIAILTKTIAEHSAQLPQMGMLISPHWIAARDDILAEKEIGPQIPYEGFTDRCRRYGLTDGDTSTLAGWLHDLGHIVYYGDDDGLKDLVVLNPEWLTKAISHVLEDKITRDNGGVLDHTRLKEIWRDRPGETGYLDKYHRYFLRLMEKFDVCYRLDDNPFSSLVAQLVPYERPNLPWEADTPAPKGIRALTLICQISEPLPGFMAWITVRRHRDSAKLHWRRGTFLKYRNYTSEALLELLTPTDLFIQVRASSPDFFFNVLRDTVENLITSRWPGVSYRLLIPCPTRAADGITCSGKFPLDFLLRYREQGEAAVPCQDCATKHDIFSLLTGFPSATTSLRREMERLSSQLADLQGDVDRVQLGVDRIEGYSAEAALYIRRLLQAISAEVTDCPRLFTFTRKKSTGGRRLRIDQQQFQLTLWCEHTGQWHPWLPATYQLRQSADWLIRIGPYVKLLLRTLQLVVPVAASLTDAVPPTGHFKDAGRELEVMKTLVEELPVPSEAAEGDRAIRETTPQLNAGENDGLRVFRSLLFAHDSTKFFGGLRRVQSPSGDFLWVCPEHYAEYDPGLPEIPGARLWRPQPPR